MSNIWNFKIALKDIGIFSAISKEYKIVFPDDLKAFIIENNAASPEANCVDIDGVERVYDETLSFNEDELDASTFKSSMNALGKNDFLPFAKDPFGNYFCYCLNTNTIAFYDHEEDKIINTDYALKAFIEGLY